MNKSIRVIIAASVLAGVFFLCEIENKVQADEVRLSLQQIEKKLKKQESAIIAKLQGKETQKSLKQQLAESIRLADAGQYEKAIALLREVIREEQENAALYQNMSWLYSQIGQWENTLEFAEMAIGLQPDMSEAHFLHGLALTKMGLFEEARAAYLETISYNPLYTQAHNNLGNVELYLKRYKDAILHYRRAIELNTDEWDA